MLGLLNIFPLISPTTTQQTSQLNLDPWQVEEDNFPLSGTNSEKLKFFLNYAVLAPSGHNTQPWLFKMVDDVIELYADTTRALPIVDPNHRELIISCGAALFNLRLAMRHFGYQDILEIFPEPQNPNFLARISFGSKRIAKAEEHFLFRAIPKRCTNRLPFLNRQLPKSLMSELEFAASSEQAWLQVISQIIPEDDREAVINLIAKGDRLQMANPLFRQELAQWIHSGKSGSHDGITAYAQGMDERLDTIAPLISFAVRSFDLGKSQSVKDQKLAAKAPILMLLSSKHDTPQDWLAIGEALEHLLLRARIDDVWASFFNQPIQTSELRSQIQALFPENGYPQILLRLGYAKDPKPTPRRPVEEVLLNIG
ncbi:Nitroreductase [Hyella patelloides LEGE 07179]|uniref:Nitroreductase n=1 Tax=Hyella patelloides LEGE 07179 TaxID=945734 RepID=A0A563VMR4_9CYAN|nr:hypothetical protein [Hyella patelloides]VEP12702.1 Nitroreductase [Hyella patelloides LEGE 07179]